VALRTAPQDHLKAYECGNVLGAALAIVALGRFQSTLVFLRIISLASLAAARVTALGRWLGSQSRVWLPLFHSDQKRFLDQEYTYRHKKKKQYPARTQAPALA